MADPLKGVSDRGFGRNQCLFDADGNPVSLVGGGIPVFLIGGTVTNPISLLAVSEPPTPPANTVIIYVMVTGTSPNKQVDFKCKFEDGSVATLQSFIV